MTLRVNWCRSCEPNFGDLLGPRLLRLYGYDVEWAPPEQAGYFTVGSILSKVPAGFTGTVYGTGFIRYGMSKDLRKARVLAVRGVGTRNAAGLSKRVTLGDPGILAPELLPGPHAGPDLGPVVIPHYVDHDILAAHPEAKVLDIRGNPDELISSVARASIVYTSSLHALILADALGVPQVLEPHPKVIGGLWKFEDYTSAFGLHVIPGQERLTPRDAMLERQDVLQSLLRELA